MIRALLTLLLIPFAVHAEPYAIVGAGFSKTDAAGSKQSTVPAFVGVGFMLNKALALEAVYVDLDARRDHRTSTSSTVFGGASGNTETTSTRTEWKGKGPGLFVAGFHQISPSVSMVGRVGAYRLTNETRVSTETALVLPVSAPAVVTLNERTTSERIWAPAFALGFQERASDRVAFRGMLEHVVGRHGDFKGATMLSVSLLYSF